MLTSIRAVLVHVAAVLPAATHGTRALTPGAGAGITDSVRPCRGDQVAIRLDNLGDDFAGMSQNGTYLVLRNASATACHVPGLPEFSLSDSAGVVPATPRVAGARFMHPGPVVVPVVVAPGAEVAALLHWISGPVFEHNVCRTPTTLSMVVGGQTKTAALDSQLCGDRAGEGIYYDVTRFTRAAARRP